MNPHIKTVAGISQTLQHMLVVLFITVDLLLVMAPVHTVKKGSWITDPAAASHLPPPSRSLSQASSLTSFYRLFFKILKY
jgi:hypothetical protein